MPVGWLVTVVALYQIFACILFYLTALYFNLYQVMKRYMFILLGSIENDTSPHYYIMFLIKTNKNNQNKAILCYVVLRYMDSL